MKQMKNALFGLAAVALMTLGSCEKDDHDHDHDETELITTVTVNFTEVGTTNTRSFSFRDPDGPGGNAPTAFDAITLQPNRQYTVNMVLLNESVTPAEDKTGEIRSEGNAHQFYFTPGAGSTITVSGLDTDAGGLPLGLRSTWTSAGTGVSTMTVTLKHKPGNKAAGDPITKGETDIEVAFPTIVQ